MNNSPQYPLIVIYYDDLYMSAKDSATGYGLDKNAIKKMLAELITKLNAFGVQTQVVNANQLAQIMCNQDSKITTNNRIILTGSLQESLFPLQANNLVYDSTASVVTALTTKNLLRDFITNGGHVIQLQASNNDYLAYLQNTNEIVNGQSKNVIIPTLCNFQGQNPILYTTDGTTILTGFSGLGLADILGIQTPNSNLFGTTETTMTYS